MSMQLQSKVLIVVLEKIEPLTVIKNETPESEIVEIGIDDILDSSDETEDLIESEIENNHLESVETQIGIDDVLDSSDEESIPDIKDIEIVLHEPSEDLLKCETVSENILVNNHTESMETQIFVKSENNPFIEAENVTQSENLNETENTSDGNVNRGTGRELIKVQGSNEHFNAFGNQTDKRLVLNFSKNLSDILRSRKAKQQFENTDFSECDKSVETTSYEKLEKDKNKRKVIEIPMLPVEPRVEPHESTTLAKEKHARNKNKSTHKQNKKRYCCEKCTFISENHSYFKRHKLSHKIKAEVDGNYHCDKCKFKTCWSTSLKRHKLKHLKPEQIPYFYCYHCPYKCNQKSELKIHIFRHFKKEEVPFHCYICDFTTLKRNLIIEHFRKHPKHHSKCDETDYKNQLYYTKKRYCCGKWTFANGNYSCFKRHKLSHETKVEVDGRHLKYCCDKCKYKTCWLTNFKTHKLTHLKPEQIPYFCCYHCSYGSKQKGNLKTHIFSHFQKEDVPFHCYICNFVTLKRDLIIEHFKTHPKHHSKCDETDYQKQLATYPKKHKKRYYSCKKCAFRTYDYEKLKLHELTHKTEAERDNQHFKYRCDNCNYKTFRYQDFKRHTVIHLKPEDIQYFYCYHCSYESKHKTNLREHILRHSKNEEINFHCYICNFMTLKREVIGKHIKMHSKVQFESHAEKQETRYWCAKCTFVTGKSASFKRHKLSHKIKKPIDNHYIRFRCDKCNYKTNVRNSLQIHQLIHLKPEEIQYFYCYHCSYKSKRKNDLADHIFRHFNNEQVQFHCYICDFMTLNRKSITEHIKKHSKVRNKSKIK